MQQRRDRGACGLADATRGAAEGSMFGGMFDDTLARSARTSLHSAQHTRSFRTTMHADEERFAANAGLRPEGEIGVASVSSSLFSFAAPSAADVAAARVRLGERAGGPVS